MLPAELIIEILEHAVENEVLFRRYSLLCSLSTLCHSWSAQSRLFLWSHVILINERDATAFLKSRGLGAYTTDYLSISGQRISPTTVTAILAKVKDVKHLRLAHFAKHVEFEASAICCPNLRGLQVLEAQDVYLKETLKTRSTLEIPLHRLEIYGRFYYWASLPLPIAFFANFSSALTELSINLGNSNTQAHQSRDIGLFLQRVGPRLQLLVLIIPVLTEPLLDALSACTTLADLTISSASDSDLHSITRALSCRPTSLTIRSCDFYSHTSLFPAILELLDEACWAKLSFLRFYHYSRQALVWRPEGEQILARLEAKGVKVAFGPAA